MSKLTADTITDEQIRELQQDREDFVTAVLAHIAVHEVHPKVQRLTLAQSLEVNRHAGHMAARARCAEILNARKGVDHV